MAVAAQRSLALDIFRGMTVCFMIIVNTPGNGATAYAPLQHANWNGFTPTDLVFPSFLFAVGNAMSFVGAKWALLPKSTVIGKILKRTLIIFLLGFLMYWFPFVHYNAFHQFEANPFSQTRFMGVLQRIALSYCFASLMVLYLKPKTILICSLGFVLLYWVIVLLFNGGADPFDMLTNAGTRFDTWVFGPAHLYHGEGVAFDPEGLLSTIPSIANVTFGYLAGQWVRKKGTEYEGLAKLMLIGLLSVLIGLGWDWFFPINKKLWTGSFVMLTVGIDCLLLAGLIYITDFMKWRKWGYFFEVFGKNPLFIYLLAELGATLLWFFGMGPKYTPVYLWLFHTIFQPAGLYFGSFLFAVAFMLVCWLVGYIMDKRKIYIRV